MAATFHLKSRIFVVSSFFIILPLALCSASFFGIFAGSFFLCLFSAFFFFLFLFFVGGGGGGGGGSVYSFLDRQRVVL